MFRHYSLKNELTIVVEDASRNKAHQLWSRTSLGEAFFSTRALQQGTKKKRGSRRAIFYKKTLKRKDSPYLIQHTSGSIHGW